MNYAEKIAGTLEIRPSQAAAAINLLDDGNTIPFIARYRKEATDSLDEVQLRRLGAELEHQRGLDERRETILEAIAAQDALTPELRRQIAAADTMTALEDLYQPYKQKRRTRASMAREKGLAPLAQEILAQPEGGPGPETVAVAFVNDEVPTTEEALAGARDIVAEIVSDDPRVRQRVREKAMQWGQLEAEKIKDAADERAVYRLYYDFQLRVDRIRPHQALALNRGEAEKVLRVRVEIEERDWKRPIHAIADFRPDRRSPWAAQLEAAIEDGAKRLLLPAIERDVRRALTETAESHAITVFAQNLRQLLRQPPLSDHTILGVDPGFRTGSKVAVIDPTGKVVETGTIHPHAPQKEWEEALGQLALWIRRHEVSLIAIGNGTASRETEQLVAELTRDLEGVKYLIVDESGASVYSASELATAELPDMDVTLRGAVSIARRAQDPLAELVKIDPRSIGVGMYQHDVNQTQLSEALAGVVESVVNEVGVDVNTTSPALLTYVSGIGPKLAERIVAHREENGRFPHRQALQDVYGLGPKSFQQAAGFLRVRDGEEPLDASAIHPESYDVARTVLHRAGLAPETPPAERREALAALRERQPPERLAADLGCGVPTLEDIFEQLVRPGRDPRRDLPPPLLRSDVLAIADLRPGMILSGTVRNVVDFGAFIDVGVKQDGLLHRSQIPRHASPGVGDVIQVSILKVDEERGRISLGWPGE